MIRRFARLACTLALIAGCAVTPPAAPSAQAQEPTTSFQSVPDSQLNQEQIPAVRLVFAAYAFVWLALFVYVFFLFQRLRRVERDVAEVNSRLTGSRR